jgi:hypothetical protein
MVRRPKPPPASKPFTSYENFLYLLTELELTVASGKISWTATSAMMTWRRLDKLATEAQQRANQLNENE